MTIEKLYGMMIRRRMGMDMDRISAARSQRICTCLAVACVAFFTAGAVAAGDAPPQQAVARTPSRAPVYKTEIKPYWFDNNSKFWYRNSLRYGTSEFVLVDAERGVREAAFDHRKLADALSKVSGGDYRWDKLPFEEIGFVDNDAAVQFTVDGKLWKCDLKTYDCTEVVQNARTSSSVSTSRDGVPPQGGQTARRQGSNEMERERRSPDGKWTAFVKGFNVYVRAEDGKEYQLSKDGVEGNAYAAPEWSPDSSTLVTWRVESGDRKPVYRIETSPQGAGRAVLQSNPYDLPGDKLEAFELSLFDVAARSQIKPEVDRVDYYGRPRLRWNKDGLKFTYEKVDRGHQRFRVIEVDTRSGNARNIIDENSETFIWTIHGFQRTWYLEKTDEILRISEEDGWAQLYRYDISRGGLVNRITNGHWVVRGIDFIDEDNRQIWFRACGVNPDQDPYFIHYYRVNFDGTGLTALTDGNGDHTISYSPDRRFLIDTYSRVDMPPVHELRRVSDGKLMCELERADVWEANWVAPEVFVAKGRDGKTDIWGIICRPKDFDPNKRYPIIEDIYAGPQDSFVPKRFSANTRYEALTNLGFIVVKIDGMGTANRSKAFHDVCWRNLKDAGFQDRILWIKAAAQKYPYMDIDRVGIYGTSAGGQNAAGAVLFHPEFYKAAVANCGCHDNRMDKLSWNEQWMGYPVGPWYSESSNIDNAGRLQGHLMLVVGELDTNVPPESTYRLVDALIKANKDFDLLVVPGGGHGAGGAYGQRRLQDFFVRHLQGVNPPNRNAVPVPK